MFRILLAAVIYLLMFVLASSCGLIHPACYAYAGTFVPLLFSFVYLYVAANIQSFGAALFLNGFVLILGLIAGEGNPAFIIGFIVLSNTGLLGSGASALSIAKGLAYLCINEDGTYKSSFAKFMTEDELSNLVNALEGEPGDLLLFAADKDKIVWEVLQDSIGKSRFSRC